MKLLILYAFVLLGVSVTACNSDSDPDAPTGQTGTPDNGSGSTATFIGPIDRNGLFTLEFQDAGNSWRFSATAENGGRITEFSLNGINIVDNSQSDPMLVGSTFWPSPQDTWGWPPPDAIDVTPYTPMVDENGGRFTLTGTPALTPPVQVTKQFAVDLTHKAVVITYTLTNTGTENAAYAPWEITRVAPGGITFFPQGTGTPTGPLPFATNDGITFFTHDPNMTSDGKLITDGAEGWLAHTDGNLILVKRFTDTPAELAAPGEGEIEIYARDAYVEVEPQGPYTQLAPGQSINWNVAWQLLEIPDGTQVAANSPSLVSAVRSAW